MIERERRRGETHFVSRTDDVWVSFAQFGTRRFEISLSTFRSPSNKLARTRLRIMKMSAISERVSSLILDGWRWCWWKPYAFEISIRDSKIYFFIIFKFLVRCIRRCWRACSSKMSKIFYARGKKTKNSKNGHSLRSAVSSPKGATISSSMRSKISHEIDPLTWIID